MGPAQLKEAFEFSLVGSIRDRGASLATGACLLPVHFLVISMWCMCCEIEASKIRRGHVELLSETVPLLLPVSKVGTDARQQPSDQAQLSSCRGPEPGPVVVVGGDEVVDMPQA